MMVSKRRAAVLACLAALAALVAACGSNGASSGTSNAAADGSGRAKHDLHVAFVAWSTDSPFFSTMKKGVDDAAAAMGVTATYVFPTGASAGAPEFAQTLQTAIAQKPDALVVANFFPAAADPLIRRAVGEGIPVFVTNSGGDSWQQDGALGYFGGDERLAGETAAKQLIAAGVSHGLCENPTPANPAVTERCTGFVAAMRAAGKQVTVLNLPSDVANDPQRETQSVKGVLTAHADIDGVFSLGPVQTANALTAIQQIGRNVKLGGFDVSAQILDDVKSGKVLFTIDQQSYLQGYMPVVAAVQDALAGLHPIGTVTTGPLVVDARNVETELKAARSGFVSAG